MSGDREKLAREHNLFSELCSEISGWNDVNAAHRIAIAYADRRVAEAVEILRRCDYTLSAHGKIDADTPLYANIRDALSPALKPNRREPTSEDAHWRDEYPMKYEPSMEEKAVARYWKLKEGGQGDE